ncbi:Ctf8p Ecym_5171 [Eremothecium cymbalariae DBVPG|uniref:Chromosome transmission fidelity protein 8 n=1 Tax=Eremothecium cymbalariae (strain CBS 270.75 / DBVPG 7215 / KCTC 17166 / NRRL Y-17582) TaxID=931890 RepID=I6ND03_ERECY|nr:hypothetical protein Ecym_5171 [Eremothecium cymbalariae DBVPG\
MPSATISVNKLLPLFTKENASVSVTTQLGNTILEIQGDLEVPLRRPECGDEDIEQRFIDHDGRDIIRFGILSYDMETKRASLYVGHKQRLVGDIIKLDPPLGILKFNKACESVELLDLIHYKVIFKERPLPIM